MAYADLTAEQKAVLTDYVRNLRAWCGEQARTNNHGAALDTGYQNMTAIFAELGDSETIPDESGLGGAQTLTKAYLLADIHPPTHGPSFQKSPSRMGFSTRQRSVILRSASRCWGVAIRSLAGSRPTGM